jgi:peptide/nickel transport system permease protein
MSVSSAASVEQIAFAAERSVAVVGWRRILREPLGIAGGLVVLLLLFVAFVLPLFLADPNAIDPSQPLAHPSAHHLLGTDPFGRDLLSRTAAGLRTSLTIAGISVVGAAVVGILLGMIAGFAPGLADVAIMRSIDAVLAFPVLLLALFVVAALGPGTTHLALSIGFVFMPYFARLMRIETRRLRNADFVQASEAYGTSPTRLLFGVILPNAITPLLVQFSLSMAFAILAEAGLSFLGLGIQPPNAALGLMLQEAQEYLAQDAWYSIVPGAAILIGVLGFNLLGDGIRDAFDPANRND